MKKTITILLAVMMILMAIAGCKIELNVPDPDDGQQTETPDTPADDEGKDDGTNEEETADTETLKAYLSAFDDALFLKDIHAVMKGEKADGVVTTMTAGTIAFDSEKTVLTIPLTFISYDFDGKAEGDSRVATGKATIVLTGATAENIFSAASYAFKDVDTVLTADAALKLDEIRMTAVEVKGAIIGKNIEIAVDENGTASGIIDVDSPEFGEATGAIAINGLNADIASAL